MRRTLTLIAIVAILIVFTSAYNRDNTSTEINAFAPYFELKNSEGTTKLNDLRGHYVLVSFWSSDNAESRIRNNSYSNKSQSIKDLKIVSINVDESESLYKEISKIDRLQGMSQYHLSDGKENEVYKSYHPESGFNSYLINREGRIEAINPTTQQLTELICQ